MTISPVFDRAGRIEFISEGGRGHETEILSPWTRRAIAGYRASICLRLHWLSALWCDCFDAMRDMCAILTSHIKFWCADCCVALFKDSLNSLLHARAFSRVPTGWGAGRALTLLRGRTHCMELWLVGGRIQYDR